MSNIIEGTRFFAKSLNIAVVQRMEPGVDAWRAFWINKPSLEDMQEFDAWLVKQLEGDIELHRHIGKVGEEQAFIEWRRRTQK